MLRFIVLVIAWLAWSGHYTLESPLIAAFGAASCTAVFLLSRRMQRFAPIGINPNFGWGLLRYPVWIAIEILKANLAVARIVVSPRLAISPCVIRVPASQHSEPGRVLFANSITLTPGTISLEVASDCIEVHALTREIADDLLSGSMDRALSAMERRA
jgi:multicomponent Na+:H+ antiporter subunit E